ncbi:MAG: hypothetical protein P8Y08_11695 [Desulfobulbaceae bacterium]
MKKTVILAIALLIIFAGFPNSYAKTYYKTFEIVEIQSDGIVLMDFEGGKLNPWQPAKITKMTDRTITLQLRSGETVDVNMRAKYSNDFMEGDQVQYKASKGQIKKSNLPELEEE